MNTKPGFYGVIEISSNTMHFTAFHSAFSLSEPVIDHKQQCALGRELGNGSNQLCPHGTKLALKTLSTYKHIIDDTNMAALRVIGTGALRIADNHKDFEKSVQNDIGLPLEIISGEEEARLAACGILSDFPNANGIVMDQGGSTLELAHIANGRIQETLSLPLGTFMINNKGKNAASYIQTQINEIPDTMRTLPALYVIGGSPRALLKAHTATHPDNKNLHGAAFQSDQILSLIDDILDAPPDTLKNEFNIKKKRRPLVPASALLLQKMLPVLGMKTLIASTHGVRHGIVHDMIANQRSEITGEQAQPTPSPA